MVSSARLLEEFLQAIQIPSVSGAEESFARYVWEKLRQLGLQAGRDEAGNVFAVLEGDSARRPILFNAHLDTVPTGPVHCRLDGDWITTEGNSILAADDKSSISVILETLRTLEENRDPHGRIEILLTVEEETEMRGAKNFDLGRSMAECFFVLDYTGAVGGFVASAPFANSLRFIFQGKAAHAGAEPEKGISAILAQSRAISKMSLGRIDHETTSNIGTMKGGSADNVVPDYAEMTGEVRSRNRDKLAKVTELMRVTAEREAARLGASVEVIAREDYQGYCIEDDDPSLIWLKKAAADLFLELKPCHAGGASDANVYRARGKSSIVLGSGFYSPHTFEEKVSVSEMLKLQQLLHAIISHA